MFRSITNAKTKKLLRSCYTLTKTAPYGISLIGKACRGASMTAEIVNPATLKQVSTNLNKGCEMNSKVAHALYRCVSHSFACCLPRSVFLEPWDTPPWLSTDGGSAHWNLVLVRFTVQ